MHAHTHRHAHIHTHRHRHRHAHPHTDTHTLWYTLSCVFQNSAFLRRGLIDNEAWSWSCAHTYTHTHTHIHFDAPPLMLTDHTCNWSSFHVYTHTHRAMTTHAHRHTNRHTRRHKHTHNLGWSLQRIKQPQTAYSGRGSPQCSGQDCRRCQRHQRAIGQPASQTSRPLEPTSPH